MKHGKTSLTQFIQISPMKCDCDTPGCFFSFIKDLFGDPVSQQTLKARCGKWRKAEKRCREILNNHDVLLLLAVGKTLVPNFYLRYILWNWVYCQSVLYIHHMYVPKALLLNGYCTFEMGTVQTMGTMLYLVLLAPFVIGKFKMFATPWRSTNRRSQHKVRSRRPCTLEMC